MQQGGGGGGDWGQPSQPGNGNGNGGGGGGWGDQQSARSYGGRADHPAPGMPVGGGQSERFSGVGADGARGSGGASRTRCLG